MVSKSSDFMSESFAVLEKRSCASLSCLNRVIAGVCSSGKSLFGSIGACSPFGEASVSSTPASRKTKYGPRIPPAKCRFCGRYCPIDRATSAPSVFSCSFSFVLVLRSTERAQVAHHDEAVETKEESRDGRTLLVRGPTQRVDATR